MDRRFGVQVHRAEEAGKAEEILVLDPGRAGALVHLHAQAVVRLPNVWGQIELRRREAVLGVAHEPAVEPDIDGLLRPLEADAHPLAPQAGVQVELPDIAAHRVVLPIDLGRAQLSPAVPGVEGVDVLDLAVPLSLHVTGNQNGPKPGIVEPLPPEIRWPGGGIGAPPEPPHSVQRLAQGRFPHLCLLLGSITHMIGMGVQAVHPEHRGIGQPVQVRLRGMFHCLHRVCLPSKFAPSIPQPRPGRNLRPAIEKPAGLWYSKRADRAFSIWTCAAILSLPTQLR